VSEVVDAFAVFDDTIDKLLDSENPEAALTEAYFSFWNRLKTEVGTASGFTGLSEYLFFKYIQKTLERKLGIEFQPHRETANTFSLRAGDIVLTHDIDISRFIKIKPQKTDIAIFVQKGGEYELITAFQLKIYITNHAALMDDLKKLDEIAAACPKARVYEILLNPPSKKGVVELRQFCEKYSGRAGVVSKFEVGCNVGLRNAVREIVERVR